MTDTLTRELAALDDALAGRPVDPDLTDLADLAAALRDDRPAPDPAFARSLDSRVERGFPRARATQRRRRGLKWPTIPMPALGVAASVLLVVGIVVAVPNGEDDMGSGGGGGGSVTAPSGSDSGSGDTEQSDGGRSARSAPPGGDSAAAEDSAGAPAPATSSPGSSVIGPLPPPSPPSPPDPRGDRGGRRSVERSAQLVLATPPRDIDRAAAEIIKIADDLRGYVVSSTVSSNSSAQFELRVPERRLQTALSRLSGVARVRERTQSAVDITGAVVSVRERLKDARTERRSLLRQLADAVTPNQTSSIRARLRLVSGQIAAAKRDLASVRTRATRSSIAVTLLADRRAGDDAGDAGGWTPRDALDDALRILEVAASVLLVALAVLLPLALLALPAWLVARQAAHRRRERALDAV